jgi:arginyl-tRNA synthetase
MLRDQIRKDVREAIQRLKIKKPVTDVETVRVGDKSFGDFSTNIAFKISREFKQSPLETAKLLTDSLKDLPYVEKLEVAGSGFVNFFIRNSIWQEEVSKVLKEGEKYGANDRGKGKKARVEFVSANPTGPLHFGNARGGPIGDVLASVLDFCGYKVIREYLHNDIGGQVDKLGESVLNLAKGDELEDQEYKGEYVKELAEKIDGVRDATEAGKKAVDLLFAEIEQDCREMGIIFDKVYPESEFVIDGATNKALEKLEKGGFLKEKEGATWFAPNDEFLKDRETVVIKSDGSYTYFANDIAYHNLKFCEDYDLIIDIFGANHHGHVPRLQAVIKALGFDVLKFHVVLYQWVRFKRGGELVKMSKRSGTFVTTREILEEVGRDALRFFILMHDAGSHIDFDLDLAKKRSKENPVYYVQYAHARICSILAKSKVKSQKSKVKHELLTTNYELDLIKQISRLPELVEDIADNFAVHRLTSYSVDLADAFHRFYENCRVIGEEGELETARMGLVKATKIVLENTLRLIGVSAPEKM